MTDAAAKGEPPVERLATINQVTNTPAESEMRFQLVRGCWGGKGADDAVRGMAEEEAEARAEEGTEYGGGGGRGEGGGRDSLHYKRLCQDVRGKHRHGSTS